MNAVNYKDLYEKILELCEDADGFGLYDHITDEDVEKCKWIAAILEALDDVPRRRMEHIFDQKKIIFDCCDFLDNIE